MISEIKYEYQHRFKFSLSRKIERIEPFIDLVVFVSILRITTGFGIFYGCFRIPKDTSEEMHFGKRKMKVCFIQPDR